jgi:hypothetical protein
MKGLGFSKPVPMGANCAVYERSDAGMTIKASLGEALSQSLIFRLGAADAGTIRRILGVIANDLSLEIKIEEWTPPLPDPLAAP